jgi:DNA polymerase III alpha subunit
MIPLHVHSNNTFLSGTIPLEKLVDRALEYGLTSLALTDTNSMHGVVQFSKLAKEKGIKPILGSLIDSPDNASEYLILLARNNQGYSELCNIITSRKLNEDFTLKDLLNKKLENIYVLASSIDLIKDVEPRDNLFIEFKVSKNQRRINRKKYEFANENGFQIVLTNPIYFLEENKYLLHKTLTAIRLRTNIDNLKQGDYVDEEFYFKNSAIIEKEWKSVPESLKNSELIAKDCNVDLKLNEYKFPVFDVPKNLSAETMLWNESYKGLQNRFNPITDEAKKRLKMELSIITEMGFSNYFLIVWDIVNEAKRRGMMTIGRGSAANSLVAFCLGITQIDPLEHNLYFERFLNKARSSPPDFDIDFSWKERDEIIKYIFEKYGYERVAMISTTVTFRARSAFREVAKAFGFTNEEISQFSRKIPWTDAANLPHLSELFPESKGLNFRSEPWKTIVNLASQIARFPRHISIHPGGIVITPTKITDYVALEYAKNKGLGLIVTQPDMYSIEDLGLIKIDILSQRSLGVLRDAMESIKKLS